jgi:hypothetical protein
VSKQISFWADYFQFFKWQQHTAKMHQGMVLGSNPDPKICSKNSSEMLVKLSRHMLCHLLYAGALAH